MAKGGNQRRRLEAKKAAERQARRRAKRRKQVMTWLVGVVLAGLVGVITFVAFTGEDVEPAASETKSPSPAPTGCPGEPKKKFSKAPAMSIDKSKTYTATMKTTKGDIVVELLDDKAPKTVNSFVFLARSKFYDNTLFHRVIADFGGPNSDMIQGGDGTACNGSGDPGYSFGDENMIPMNEPGYFAMANSGPGTNGSQFFLLSGTVTHLNVPGSCPGPQGCHSVFGKVTAGLDVLATIADAPKDEERPNPPIIVESVTIKES